MIRCLLFALLCAVPQLAVARTAVYPANSLAKYASAPPPLALTFRSGFIAKPDGFKMVFAKVAAGMPVASVEASAEEFDCQQLAVVTLYDCGASHACTAPSVVASVNVTSSGSLSKTALKPGTAIGAGHYYAWAVRGKCSGIDVTATVRAAAN